MLLWWWLLNSAQVSLCNIMPLPSLPPPPHTHHHHKPPVGSEDRDSNSSSLQWPGKTCPPHQPLPLCQGYHGGSNHIQRCVLYHNTVIGASLSEPHISVLNASCACMFEHLLHAHTSIMHTPPSCTHLPHTHTHLPHAHRVWSRVRYGAGGREK